MRIGFHYDSFSLRGVDQASFEYTGICEEILGDDVFVLKSNRESSKWISDHTSEKVRERFNVYDYDGTENGLQELVCRLRLDSVYVLNTGYLDERFKYLETRVWNHSVFPGSDLDFGSEGFAVISDWLSAEYFAGKCRVVPHIVPAINTKFDLRDELGIPKGDVVLGSMGGRWNFNSKTATKALLRSLEKRSDLWLISLNQVICASHRRLIQLPGTGIESRKHEFISTCDYMLHGRSEGETFGIACGELCNAGKPVIAWKHAPQRAHLDQFVLKGYGYSGTRDLENMLCGLNRNLEGCDESRRLAQIYSRERVARLFDSVFRRAEDWMVDGTNSLDTLEKMARYGSRRILVELMKRDQLTKRDFQLQCGTSILTE